MFNASTKEAIKAALSIVIAICLALYFQWEKPYWAAIAVAVMALNESFAHSLNKGYDRLLGTVLGIGYAFFLIAMFSQDQFLFLAFLTLFLGVCIFMSSDAKYGYIFTMGFSVCSIIACMGGFDNQATFHFALLRVQETVLGVITFSVVYRLVWPVSTEQNFLQLFEASRFTIIKLLTTTGNVSTDSLESITANIAKLYQLLNLPLTGSYHLKQYRKVWRDRVNELAQIQSILLESNESNTKHSLDSKKIIEQLENFDSNQPQFSLVDNQNNLPVKHTQKYWHQEKRSTLQRLNEDSRKVFQGVAMFVTSILVWIYLPVPGGFIFPLLAGVFSCVLPTMPPSVLKDGFLGVIGTGTFILLQYVFLMPLLGELWQLALFYFINVIIIWNTFSTPKLMIHRVLGINLLVVLTSGALNLTPVYRIETPLLMLTNILIILMIAKLFSDLFRAPNNV